MFRKVLVGSGWTNILAEGKKCQVLPFACKRCLNSATSPFSAYFLWNGSETKRPQPITPNSSRPLPTALVFHIHEEDFKVIFSQR